MGRAVHAIHQFLPSFAPRDAVSGHTKQVQDALRDLGYDSEIYAEIVHPDEQRRARDFTSFGLKTRPDTVLMYRLSMGSPLAGKLAARIEPLAIDYHNITPVEFMEGWEPLVASQLRRGRRDLKRLSRRTTFATTVSQYNADELTAAGYERIAVVPNLIDTTQFEREVDPAALERLDAAKQGGGIDILFVGRISPNKCQHDLIRLLAFYRRVFDPHARLRLVGGSSSHAYETTLRKFADGLGLGGAVDFAGSVTEGELAAHYRNADVFVSMSQHEGFCIPLVEAMANDVPVIALGTSAIPEVLGDGGIVLPSLDLATFSTAIDRVVSDPTTRADLVSAGRARVEQFSLAAGRRLLADAVDQLVTLVDERG